MLYFFVTTVAFILSLVASIVLTPVAQNLSRRLNIVAVPGGRRKHAGNIPKLGGIPIFFAFVIGAIIIYLFAPPTGQDAIYLRGILIGFVFVFVGSLLDDYFDLPWWVQYIILVGATVIAFIFELFFETFTIPTVGVIELNRDFPSLATFLVPILTLFWISGMMITVNWLDGLDGLATGVGIIATLLIFGHSLSLEQWSVAIFPLVLASALIGFLIFNFSPAKIFLGSAGAYLIGYSIATLSLISPAKIATALLVMGVPILDVAWQIINRIRKGKSPFSGDRGHLHFRLSDRGYDTKVIVLGYYLVASAFGLIAIFAPGIWKLIMLTLLSIAVLILFSILSGSGSPQRIQKDVEGN